MPVGTNKELQLLTGLVAHLAYNLKIEETSSLVFELLQPQMNEDFRVLEPISMISSNP